MTEKNRAPMNRTLTLTQDENEKLCSRLLYLNKPVSPEEILNKTICQDLFEAIKYLPEDFVDLMIIDPPYNLNKSFNGRKFKQKNDSDYAEWLDSWLSEVKKVLKEDSSVYVCADWATSAVMYPILKKHFKVRNRITWEREKGRGSKTNWKNSSEDIWFCTMSDEYCFNVDSVKLKRKVIAPYRHQSGQPKDWEENGVEKYRLTHPSNIWTDITVPFWSMPENTDHPTQKPEKLVAKLILASSELNDVVFDPFLGSGTTSVVAKKLRRCYVGIELEEEYCCLAEKRLEWAGFDKDIQGYSDGVFWERNSLSDQKQRVHKTKLKDSINDSLQMNLL